MRTIFGLFLCLALSVFSSTQAFDIKIVTGVDQLYFNQTKDQVINQQQEQLVNQVFASLNLISPSEKINSLKFKDMDDNGLLTLNNGGNIDSYKQQQAATIALRAYEKLTKQPGYDKEYKYKVPDNVCNKEDAKWDCDPYYPYRRFDGACNNLKHAWWGASSTPYQRLGPVAYDDGINKPRTLSASGDYLPNPRTVALNVHTPNPTKSDYSHLLVWFGQFVGHDLTLVATTIYGDGKEKHCPCVSKDPDCWSIPIPYEDYYNRDQKCFVFTRSAPALKYWDCYMGAREQLNLLTAWLDLSQLYGNTEKKGDDLRTYKGGLLKSSQSAYNAREHLPKRGGIESCLGLKRREKCYKSGDSRAEDNGFLLSMHTIWLREHNRIAKKLCHMNPEWDDEMIFQEARQITIAEYQNVLYGEWLPLIVGESVAKQFGLLPLKYGYFMGYDDKTFPNVDNEWAVAAYRFGHTLIQQFQKRADYDYYFYSNRTLDYFMFNQELPEYGGGLDSLARSSLADWSYYPTPQVNHVLNNYLFDGLFWETESKRFSLPALNIQRGRDHGVSPYVYYRELCGVGKAETFEDLTNIPPYVLAQLKKVYADVMDIDLWTGLVSEYHLNDGVVGPTAACILAKGFRDWKYGDRWYYENGHDDKLKFTEKQLNDIRRTTFSGILCDNIDVDYVQKLAFLKPNKEYNQLLDCSKFYSLNLKSWKSY